MNLINYILQCLYLLVGDKVVFESIVILDYINTLTPYSLLPADNLEELQIEQELNFLVKLLVLSGEHFQSQESFNEGLTDLKWYFQKLEAWLQQTKYIYSNEITLADFAYAPIFTLLHALKPLLKINPFDGFPRLYEYSEAILALPGVQSSKVENYDLLIQKRLSGRNPYFITL